jgi:hypothetical protein
MNTNNGNERRWITLHSSHEHTMEIVEGHGEDRAVFSFWKTLDHAASVIKCSPKRRQDAFLHVPPSLHGELFGLNAA